MNCLRDGVWRQKQTVERERMLLRRDAHPFGREMGRVTLLPKSRRSKSSNLTVSESFNEASFISGIQEMERALSWLGILIGKCNYQRTPVIGLKAHGLQCAIPFELFDYEGFDV